MRSRQKKSGALAPLKNCVDPIIPDSEDLILIDGATLHFARQGLLPRLGPPGLDLAVQRLSKGDARSTFLTCHHFQQRMFKITAADETIGLLAI